METLAPTLPTLARTSFSDVVEGAIGAAGMLFDLATPFLRPARSHWGLGPADAAREFPGDALVPDPVLSWAHGVEIDAPPEAVWPWVAQIGQNKGGFYSYQFLENLAGCGVVNADRIHDEWQHPDSGEGLKLHRASPGLPIAAMEDGRWFVAHASFDPSTGAPSSPEPANGRPFVNASWRFLVEPLSAGRSRFVSRFRCAYEHATLATRLAFGPYLVESIGFVMDRRMLLGVKERVERART